MRNIILSASIFILFCFAGIYISRHNPIENDESYSQHQSIQNLSYLDILLGRVDEGNNCPLFYLSQKAFGQLCHFKLSTMWVMEQYVCEEDAQWLMRVLPVMFMGLCIALCFYYFLQRYNLVAACMVLLLFLTTPLIWIYGAQNRPYTLWMLLTAVQTLLLFEYFIFKNNSQFFWRCLTATNWLLCLCSGFGLLQTLLAMVFIRKKWLLTFILPFLVALFYAQHAPKYPFRMPHEWMGLLLANLSLDRLCLLAACSLCLRKLLTITLWFSTLLGLGLLLIGAIYLQHTPGLHGFELSPRYFLFLLPTSILVLVIFMQEMLRAYGKNFWIKLVLFQAFFYIVIMGGFGTYIVLHRLL